MSLVPDPTFTVVVPVYNRQDQLRRALDSLVAQSVTDFECIVVDDRSTCPIAPVVAEYDDRFVYVRNTVNAGPTGARFLGFERMRGDYLIGLDSDNELLPWTLDRALVHLVQHPDVGGVTGLYEFPDGLHVRVVGGSAIFTPTDYIAGNAATPGWDCVAAYRRATVEEWLTHVRRDYYMMEFALVLCHRMRHSQLFVDEPWGRYHVDAPVRVTTTVDPRNWRDPVIFVEDQRPKIGTMPCVPVDRVLRASWAALMRGRHHDEAEIVRDWMQERGSTRFGAMREYLAARARTRLSPVSKPSVKYLRPLAANAPNAVAPARPSLREPAETPVERASR